MSAQGSNGASSLPTVEASSRVWNANVGKAVLGYLLVGLAALLPRVVALGRFADTDEVAYWLQRSELFLQAIRSGDFAATAITSHPGVTTMWLGAAGMSLRRTLFAWHLVVDESFPTVLALIRLPAALTHVLAIVVGYWLLCGMLPRLMATLAALLWASEPVLIGYSRMLHVDALAASFAMLSLLAACAYWNHRRGRKTLVLSAICGALAILSKSPAAALLPIVAGIALWHIWRQPASGRARALLALLAWGGIAGITLLVVWPALWAAPMSVVNLLRIGVTAEGAVPHRGGNFFLGQVNDRPGWIYYLLALPMRLTPWTLAGLILLPVTWRRIPVGIRPTLLALAAFVLLFLGGLTLFPAKLARYVVPVLPATAVLAAAGLVGAMSYLGLLLNRSQQYRRLQWTAGIVPIVVTVIVAAFNLAAWHPYTLAYFNPLLGGERAGARTFLLGAGEGMEQVAAWLNQQPNITGVTVLSPLAGTLQPYLRPGARAISVSSSQTTLPPTTGYVVVTINRAQLAPVEPPLDRFYERVTPLHTVSIHGVPYAWIYEAPPATPYASGAVFGDALQLEGYDAPKQSVPGQAVTLRLVWDVRTEFTSDTMLFAHLLRDDGERVAQVDIPLPTTSWHLGRFPSSEIPIAVPATTPPGTYRLFIGLYNPTDGQRLALTAAPVTELDGPDALELMQVRIEPTP